ncbi:hypothetical protein BZG35_09200 [Brevundimonas sp. LM2]|uniref:hypothetical protein n=1 Tax=Brevundimonas sp. LM2 TaxID=1938605 RepID=UPI000983E490|nr:hypothetical protein [Brevundimonas sp. LM2]AQR61811.1 hypothetical protein BZG35_09200 [Brevundimonas sp. LM2]
MSNRLRLASVSAFAILLTACDAVSEATPSPEAETPARAKVAALAASGVTQTLAPAPADDSLQASARVVRVDRLTYDDAKLFGTAGGDPAMNGLQTYLAFFVSPDEGWTIFRIGDVLDYTVLSASPGRVELDLQDSLLDVATGTIGSRHRKVIVAWTPGAEGAPPAAVTVTPGA